MEIWKDAVGWEGYYQVSNLGRVRSVDRVVEKTSKKTGKIFTNKYKGKIISSTHDRGGYLNVSLRKTRHPVVTRKVHQMVLEAFVGLRPEGSICRHLDGNPENNNVENLKWGTHAENSEDSKKHGTLPIGEKHGGSKLTEDQVFDMRERYANGGVSHEELCIEYGISRSVASGIIRGQYWPSVGGRLSNGVKHNQKLSFDTVQKIWEMILGGSLSQREIGERFGVSQTMIAQIKAGKTYAGSDPRLKNG